MSGPDRPKSGFVLGKFMPPHQGHVHLCDFGRAYCERLTILVCSLPDDPIPGELRFRWMRELFPDCDVRWCAEPLPQEPADHPEFWPIWREVVLAHGGRPDVVFASEDYGHRLAAEVGARFVPVDIGRTARPVSGTAVRADPFGEWAFLPQPVRPWFVKRVCLFGPESTGKSTLAARLAARFGTLVAPEYGRTYTDAFGTDVGPLDLERIVQGHLATVEAAKRQANRVLFEDTDPVLSAVWSDMLTGGRAPWLDAFDDYADLYLLCDVDVPWTDDGTRYFPSPADRQRFFHACEAELKARGVDYVRITGASWADRETQAAAAVRGRFPSLPEA
ncbi:AAA family ATPase [Caulobacter sp. 17J65-9]|uniref:AAA family ATPase n=1 Tax=Caulobacter sp. 17J65-9 TaxID=2709382 RepID=UPI0013C67722|nr:AAA family ATPase [Caulobacter sp. 17J65-9]NEX93345.1 AAA family ATPase [Caulobacter sp. 17J65-9]